MDTQIDLLEAEVLNCDAADRARLLESLIASFNQTSEIEAEWMEEARRREEAVEAGLVTLVSGPETLAQLRAKYS